MRFSDLSPVLIDGQHWFDRRIYFKNKEINYYIGGACKRPMRTNTVSIRVVSG
jgi:hypothetical protein